MTKENTGNTLYDLLKDKVKNPIIGTYIISFFTIHHNSILRLIFGEDTISIRLDSFHESIIYSEDSIENFLYIYGVPLILAFVLSILSPLFKLGILKIIGGINTATERTKLEQEEELYTQKTKNQKAKNDFEVETLLYDKLGQESRKLAEALEQIKVHKEDSKTDKKEIYDNKQKILKFNDHVVKLEEELRKARTLRDNAVNDLHKIKGDLDDEILSLNTELARKNELPERVVNEHLSPYNHLLKNQERIIRHLNNLSDHKLAQFKGIIERTSQGSFSVDTTTAKNYSPFVKIENDELRLTTDGDLAKFLLQFY